ncbi:unnamed protein product, partial [Gulo gulo]
ASLLSADPDHAPEVASAGPRLYACALVPWWSPRRPLRLGAPRPALPSGRKGTFQDNKKIPRSPFKGLIHTLVYTLAFDLHISGFL